MAENEVALVRDGRAVWRQAQEERFAQPSRTERHLRERLARADAGLERLERMFPEAALLLESLREDIKETR
jgi:hypothetical protein